MTTKTAKYDCDLCPETFNFPQVLGRHKRTAHGIAGASLSAIKRQETAARATATPAAAELQCPHCEFIAARKGGLTKHIRAAHPTQSRKDKSLAKRPAQTLTVNGQAHEEGQANRDAITETILAIAFGRFQGLCSQVATEYDLPPRMFAARLTELIYRTQIR